MNKDFFSLLREKLNITPSKEFDRRFWENFDRNAVPKTLPSRWRIAFPVVSLGAAALALMIYLQVEKKKNIEIAESQSVQTLLADADMLNDMDLFSEFDELPVDDAEWKLLLGEG